jgi:hypothetical protein
MALESGKAALREREKLRKTKGNRDKEDVKRGRSCMKFFKIF